MCFDMLVTYNELTCVLLRELKTKYQPEELWGRYKSRLIFGSARKYAKNNDQFVQLERDWKELTGRDPEEWLRRNTSGTGEENAKSIGRSLRSLKNVGRFAADLFIETVCALSDFFGVTVKVPFELDWKNCANLTSGIYNIFYEDERANEFDKKRTVSRLEEMYLSKKLLEIQEEIKRKYPEQNCDVSMFVGKICSFRNLFKGARYGGFHHDRELGWLREYEKEFPELGGAWGTCYEIRRELFDERFLGEVGGWDGIRKERKKLWLTTGMTGVEK